MTNIIISYYNRVCNNSVSAIRPSDMNLDVYRLKHNNRTLGGDNMDDLNKLIEYVKNLTAGEITGENEKQVVQLLYKCWDEFDGSSDTSMSTLKLHRYENLTFDPPATIEFAAPGIGANYGEALVAFMRKYGTGDFSSDMAYPATGNVSIILYLLLDLD